jgi:Flp pilus assembly CpaE family ATPase
MVYSMKADSDQLVRCMRAGAREFLTLPFAKNTVAEALARAATRRPPAPSTQKKAGGRLMVFLGAKGGDGVTTLACNFAVSMAKESGQSTLLIDLDLPLGDAALNLGVVAEYSTINALQNAARLDSAFLSKLLVKHSSGVFVLAAPGKFPQFDASHDAIDRLIAVARQDFDNVVIDMGSRLDLMGTSLFKDGSTVYLVIQAGIAGLRNSNRLISQYFATGIPKLEIVLNRFQSRTLGVGEDEITKALTRPAQWKIPNDYAAVRRMQHTAIPLALEDSPISRLIRQMARTACGLPAIAEKGPAEKGSGFSLKNLGRSFASKLSSSEELPPVSMPEPAPIAEKTAPTPAAPAETPAKSAVDAEPVPAAAAPPAAEIQPQSAPTESVEPAAAKAEVPPPASAPAPSNEPETRSYRGATYVKGTDGKWYLQKTQAGAESAAAEEAVKPQTPVIAWPVPAPIIYGAKLSAELNATASVPGKFVYTPAEGEALAVGEHSLTAVFTPEDTKGYTAAEATVKLTVTKADAAITWATPVPIIYGAALDGSQLNATASVPGEFAYTPAEGVVLPAGEHALSVSFTPADAASYETASTEVQISVAKAIPAITWAAPAPIIYGAALNGSQLNAVASVPGEFAYTPAAGEVLAAGEHTLSVSFTPADAASYETASTEVQISVAKAIPAITWAAPASIIYGVTLDGSQLNATASVSGEFAYTPAAGEVMAAGEHTLSVSFMPADAASYETASTEVQISVAKAIPAITWAAPAPIIYGAALDGSQLNATASVPGEFAYTPTAGEVQAAGEHTLSAFFTPADAASYETATAAVQITVAKAVPSITWAAPPPIAYGAALGSYQLNATASVLGEFVYSPASGEVLSAGEHTLAVSFTPQDAANYTVAEASVPLTVTKATPIILWPAGEAIAEGTALSDDQLNATALVEGSFEYTPAAGEVLAAGTHTLSVTFTPKAAGEYNIVYSSVLLTVIEAAPVIEAPAPAPAEDSLEPVSSPLDAAPEPSTGAAEESEAASLVLESPSEEAPAETAVEAEAAPAVEAPAEPVAGSFAEAVEAVPAETPAETTVEAETEPAVEAPAELVVEPVVEAVEAVSEEAPAVEAEAAPAVEVPAAPVTEPVVVAAAVAPIEVPAVEPMVSAGESSAEAPDQALVRIPPPKFTFEAGSGLNLMGTAVFPDGTTIYLVMQPGSGGHVDSQKLVSQFLSGGELKPEIEINRYEPRSFSEDDEQLAEDLAQAANQPSEALREAVVQPASRPLAAPEKKRGFLKGLRQSLWARVSSNEKSDEFTHLDLRQRDDATASSPFVATAQVRVNPEVVSTAAPLSVEEPRTPVAPARGAEAQEEEARQEEAYSAPAQVETRTYQGATYVKGADGKWHLQQTPSRTVKRETPPAPEPLPAPAPFSAEEESAQPAADPSPEAQAAPAEAAPVQAESVSVLPTPAAPMEASAPVLAPAAPIETEPLAVPSQAEPQAIEAEAAALQTEEQVPVEVTAPLASAEPVVSLPAEPPVLAVEVEHLQEAAEVASEPPVEVLIKAEAKSAPLQAKNPAKAATPVAGKSMAKAPAKAAVKAKPAVKAAKKAPAKPAVKAKKTKKAVKASPKPAAKAKKSVKAPAKAALKSKKTVKAPLKAAVKGRKPVKSSPKTVKKVAVKAKKPTKTVSKTQGKAAVRKAVKSPAKPAAKKKAAKAPARKPAKKR